MSSLRGSGLGYITGTSVNPSNCLTRLLSWVTEEAVGPVAPIHRSCDNTQALCGADIPVSLSSAHSSHLPHPLSVAVPGISLRGSPGRRDLISFTWALIHNPLLGSWKKTSSNCAERESEWKRDRGGWRRVKEKTFAAHYFWVLSGVSCSWVQTGKWVHRGLMDDASSSCLGVWPHESSVFSRHDRWTLTPLITADMIRDLFLYWFINIVLS